MNELIAPECPWCHDRSPRMVETSRYWCSHCQQEFMWLTPTEYVDAIAASRPGLLVGDLLRGSIPVVFPSPDEPRKT